jgi:hypothetical protein
LSHGASATKPGDLIGEGAQRCAPRESGLILSQYFFHIQTGQFAGESEINLPDDATAWAELRKVCGDLVGSITRKLNQNTDWQMEILDESKKPVFRISVVAETLS